MRIGIELNGVVRNLNAQYLKYYLKDINPTFDDTQIDEGLTDIFDKLEFENKSKRYQFKFEDYPYEIFGCAAPMTRNLHTFINGWIHENEDDFEEIAFFSMGEEELTIQSTYFYLSKSGSRMRNMVFPLSVEEVWNRFDIVITTNKEIIKKKPKGKIVILINKSDNKNLKSKSDYNYDNLETFLGDNETLTKIKNINETQVSLLTKIKQNIRKLIKR